MDWHELLQAQIITVWTYQAPALSRQPECEQVRECVSRLGRNLHLSYVLGDLMWEDGADYKGATRGRSYYL